MKINNCIVIDDNPEIRTLLKLMLENENFKVGVFHSAEDYLMDDERNTQGQSIYLIDLKLPGLSGINLVKLIRHKDPLSPIFMISGECPEESFIPCMKAGADDFVSKPFHPEHLLLKIRNAQAKLEFSLLSMINHGVKLMPSVFVVSRNGEMIKLTGREYSIIDQLLSNTQTAHSRETLLTKFDATELTERTIDVHISTLRKKILSLNLEIETRRGLGYQIVVRES